MTKLYSDKYFDEFQNRKSVETEAVSPTVRWDLSSAISLVPAPRIDIVFSAPLKRASQYTCQLAHNFLQRYIQCTRVFVLWEEDLIEI